MATVPPLHPHLLLPLLFSLALLHFLVHPATAALTTYCVTPPKDSINLYQPSSCLGYAACDASFCNCVSASTNGYGTALQCAAKASSALSSATLAQCIASQVTCLTNLAVQARSDPLNNCSSWAATSYIELLKTAVRSNYSGSGEEAQCQYFACELANATTNGADLLSGGLASIYAQTCYPRDIERKVVLQGTLQLGGSLWRINSQQQAGSLIQLAFAADISSLLAVNSNSITATVPTVKTFAGTTSLTIEFAVYETASSDVQQYLASIQSALSAPLQRWLPTTLGQYGGTDATLQTFGASATSSTVAPLRHEYYMAVSGRWSGINQMTKAYANRTGSDALEVLNRALVADIAKYLGTVTSNVVVATVMYCRLIVRFSIAEAAGFNDAAVTAKLEAAPSVAGWLSNTATVFADIFVGTSVASDTVVVQNVTSVVRDFSNITNTPFAAMMVSTGCVSDSITPPPPLAATKRPNPTLVDPGYLSGSESSSAVPPSLPSLLMFALAGFAIVSVV